MRHGKSMLWIGLAAALLIAGLLSPRASSHPDGLERVAEDFGFIGRDAGSVWRTPLSNYELTWLGDGTLSTGAAGMIGVLLTFAVIWGVGRMLLVIAKVKSKDRV